MRVLITGGAGYIGQSLLSGLEKNSEIKEIIVLDNLKSTCNNFFIGRDKLLKAKFIKGDILNYDVLKQVVANVDVIYHLAATTSHAYTYAQNIQFEQINQWGTLNLVRSIQHNAKHLKKIYYLSSMAVFGLKSEINLEKDSPQPTNAYGKSKFEGEKYITLLKDHCEVGIIRSANVFGFNNGFRNDSVLNKFIFNSIVHKKILIYGDGTQCRPFVSLESLVIYLCDLLIKERDNKIFREHIIDFNATMNDIKNELLNYIPELEYTYLNTNLKYDGQSVKDVSFLKGKTTIFEKAFKEFDSNIRF